jgi:hypothetical protein
MPGKLLTLVELFGYRGNRHESLRYSGSLAGARVITLGRSIADTVLPIFHLVLSSFTLDSFDIAMTQLRLEPPPVPPGVFFPFGAASQPR